MNKSVHTVLAPLLVINYVFGLRVVQLPSNHYKPWFGIFYIFLAWLIYYLLRVHILIVYSVNVTNILLCLCEFTALLSVLFGMYYNKKFRNCLKRLAIVDDTLEKLGTITNYQQLRRQIIWIVLGWLIIVVFFLCMQLVLLKNLLHYDTITAIIYSYIANHCPHVLLLGDLTMTCIIWYIGIKFKQINEHLRNIINNNKYEMTQAWDNTALHITQQQFAKTPSNKWMILIIMQLHLELRKISRELDSLYGVEMTWKVGLYFIYMALDLNNIFHVIFIQNYKFNTPVYVICVISWCFHNILKLFMINLMCEKVCNQSNTVKNFLNKILHCMKDVEAHENISQLLLNIKQSPLKFKGIGLYQLGYKFIYEFIVSVGTLLVILIQAHTESDSFGKIFKKIH